MIGNASLLDLPDKVAFLASRRVSPQDVMRCYDWATDVRDKGQCIMSGFQSALEKDVLRFLLRGKAPIILVLARRLWRKIPEELRAPINEGRLLLVSPVSAARASASTATTRNRIDQSALFFPILHRFHLPPHFIKCGGKSCPLVMPLATRIMV